MPPDSNADSVAVHVQAVPYFPATQAAAIQSMAIRGQGAMRMEAIRTVGDAEGVVHELEMKLWLLPYD